MDNITNVLANLVENYYKSVSQKDNDTRKIRIVIPGLTRNIATSLHKKLLRISLPSYLVVDKETKPNSEKKFLYADALTSLRENDFIAICYPGEIAYIQDSIKGSGGTIRSLRVSEEWPWVEANEQYFSFEKDFIPIWLDTQGFLAEDQCIAAHVLKTVIKDSENVPARAELVLENILGKFSTSLYEKLENNMEKLFFHIGLPWPSKALSCENIQETLHSLSELQKRTSSANKEVGKRNEIQERALQLQNEGDLLSGNTAMHIDMFFDGVSLAGESLKGILSFARCWSEGTDNMVEAWKLLNEKTLRDLYTLPKNEKSKIRLHSLETSCDGSLIDESKQVVFTYDFDIITATVDISSDEKNDDLEILLKDGSNTLLSTKYTGEPTKLEFTANNFRSIKQKHTIHYQLRKGQSILDEGKILLYPCSVKNPLRIVLKDEEQPYQVITPTPVNNEEEGALDIAKIEVNGSRQVFILAYNENENIALRCNDDDYELQPIGSNGTWRTKEAIAPTAMYSGRAEIEINAFGKNYLFQLEAKNTNHGEYTIFNEFLQQFISYSSTNKLKLLMKLFTSGTTERYPYLGKLDERSQLLGKITSTYFEKLDQCSAKPLIIPAEGSLKNQISDIKTYGYTRTIGINLPPVASDRIFEDTEVYNLFQMYTKRKHDILKHFNDAFEVNPTNMQRPLYAEFPVYVDDSKELIESYLEKYIYEYSRIIDYLHDNFDDMHPSERFLLGGLDTIIAMDKENNPTFAMLSPWHPLVLTRRYFLQKSLYRAARKYQNNSAGNSKAYHKLAVLLERAETFKWHPLITRDAKFDTAYTSTTTDQGWILCIPAQDNAINVDKINQVTQKLSNDFGIDSSILPASNQANIDGYIKQFLTAYPHQRRVNINIGKNHAPTRDLFTSVTQLLQGQDGLTETAKMLPGGVHLYFSEPNSDLDKSEWSEPPVCLYNGWNKNADIHLVPPIDTVVLGEADNSIPRVQGKGDNVVFTRPILTEDDGLNSLISVIQNTCPCTSNNDAIELASKFTLAMDKTSKLVSRQKTLRIEVGLPRQLSSSWAIVPGMDIDPAIFIEYINEGYNNDEQRSLWDYKVDITGRYNTYFVLSRVTESFISSIRQSPLIDSKEKATKLIHSLGKVGVSIGGESLKTAMSARGAIGLAGGVRLFIHDNLSPISIKEDRCGFILPVDSFKDFFGDGLEINDSINTRFADLFAMQFYFPDHSEKLMITACAVECKYATTRYDNKEKIIEALSKQARPTFERIKELILEAKKDDGVIERLALMNIIHFGLRLVKGRRSYLGNIQQKVLQKIIDQEFEFIEPTEGAILVSTGLEETTTGIHKTNGWHIKLTKDCWPDEDETVNLTKIRKELSTIFDPIYNNTTISLSNEIYQNGETTKPEQPEQPEQSDKIDIPPEAEQHIVEKNRTFKLKPILLGSDQKLVYYDPTRKEQNENPNIMITGSSGKGKTQFIKSVIMQLREQKVNTHILDFKNDFAPDKPFVENAQLHSQYITYDGMAFNPLIPPKKVHPNEDKLIFRVAEHIIGIASIFKNTYNLGDQQEAALKNAIRTSFRQKGIPYDGIIDADDIQDFPDFNNVGEILEEQNPKAYNRLDPLFALGIFKEEHRNVSFESILNRSIIFALSDISNDELKNALAKIVIKLAHGTYNAREHASSIQQYFIIDEAHRVLNEDFVAAFTRECRAYGVGMILSSQYPHDFEKNISSSLATKVIHGNGDDASLVKEIENLLGYKGDTSKIAKLGLFEAIINNEGYHNVQMTTLAYPLYLLYMHLTDNGPTPKDEMTNIKGLDTGKLDLELLLSMLKKMWLIEEIDGKLYVLDEN